MSSGRPPTPLEARLATRVSRTIPEDLLGWPLPGQPCWTGPSLTHHEGKMHPTRRLLFEVMFGKLHPTHKIQSQCATAGCLNPHHATLILINRKDGTPVEPLPTEAFAQFAQHVATEDEDLNDCADWIVSFDEGRTSSPEYLYERCQGVYPEDLIARALVLAQDL